MALLDPRSPEIRIGEFMSIDTPINPQPLEPVSPVPSDEELETIVGGSPEIERQDHVLKLAEDLDLLNRRTRDGGSLDGKFEEIRNLSDALLTRESLAAGYDVTEGNDFVLLSVDGSDPMADIGFAVEARVFADKFSRTTEEVYEDYGPYNESSKVIICIDARRRQPAGAMRIVYNSPIGMPDINVLGFNDSTNNGSDSEPLNPWLEEIAKKYRGENDEQLSERQVLQHLMFDSGVRDTDVTPEGQAVPTQATKPEDVDVAGILDRTINVATLSVLRQYGRGESVPGPSTALYNGVVRTARALGAEYLVAIQDQKPFELLQAFGRPFDEMGLEPRPYGGPDPTVPGFSSLREGLDRMDREAPGLAEFITQGNSYDSHPYYMFAYMPKGYWAGKDAGHQTPPKPQAAA